MHTPASRQQPSARSRMLSPTGSGRARRDLGDVLVHGVSIIVHDASHVAHDVGHAVGDVLSGQVSNLPGDIVKTGSDLVKTGKDVVGVVHGALGHSNNNNSGGSGSSNGDQNPSGGGEGGTQPTPPAAPGAGGGEGGAQTASRSVSSSTATPPASATSFSSENSAPAPSTSIHTVVRTANFGWQPQTVNTLVYGGAGPEGGQAGNGVWSAPSSTASDTQSSTTMGGALPGNGSGDSHRKGFPLAAAAALGAVLGFLVVSALFWAVWLYLRKRRRAAYPAIHRAYVNRMLSVTTARTVSTVPLFISASEAGVKDENPFKHPRDADEEEGDPFDAASLWRSSTARSVSTLSV